MMKKTILCDESQKEYLLEQEAETQVNGIKAISNIQTVSLTSLIHKEKTSNALETVLLASRLRTKAQQFPLYRDMFAYPVFIEEVLSFAKECLLYQIKADELPAENTNEKELKMILAEAMQMDLAEKNISASDIINQIHQEKDICILDGFETDYFQYQIVQQLSDLPHMHWTAMHRPSFALRHGLNATKEIEACAQDIIANHRNCTVILVDPNNLPVLEAVFSRYELPYSCTIKKRPARISTIYASLVQFALHPDKEHLFTCIDLDAFGVSCPEDIHDFLKQAMCSIHYPDDLLRRFNNVLFEGDGNIDPHTMQTIERLDKKARQWYASIQDQITHLLNTDNNDYPEISEAAVPFLKAYDLISTSSLYKDPSEYTAARRITNDLSSVLPHIQNREAALCYADMLGKGSCSDTVLSEGNIVVTDLTHPVPCKDYTYVLGCSASSYPALPIRTGIFDEEYVKKVKGFPALEDRTAAYQSQLNWIQYCSEKMIFWSYPTNDYDGKSIEPAFEVTSMFDQKKEDQPWPVDEGEWHLINQHVLNDKKLRKALFTNRNHMVYGSVSSVETWFECPYQYFLKYGMHLNTSKLPALDGITTGNLQHAVLEAAARKYKKKYAEKLPDEMKKAARIYLDAIKVLMPVYTSEIDLTYQRLIANMELKAQCYSDYEKDSIDFIPNQEELSFDHFPISDHVSIQGKIDRIDVDHAHHLFRIIDYKTSALSINEKDVAAGTSLQLLSYLVAVNESKEIQKQISPSDPAAMLYYPLVTVRNTMGTTKGSTIRDDESRRQLMMKNNAVHGWSFIDAPELIDADMNHITAVKTQHLYDQSKALLNEVYEFFYTSLQENDACIEPHPIQQGMSKACTFCNFQTICRYHGDGYPAERVSEIKTTKEKDKKKGDKNED